MNTPGSPGRKASLCLEDLDLFEMMVEVKAEERQPLPGIQGAGQKMRIDDVSKRKRV